jgi:hypothetical protein
MGELPVGGASSSVGRDFGNFVAFQVKGNKNKMKNVRDCVHEKLHQVMTCGIDTGGFCCSCSGGVRNTDARDVEEVGVGPPAMNEVDDCRAIAGLLICALNCPTSVKPSTDKRKREQKNKDTKTKSDQFLDQNNQSQSIPINHKSIKHQSMK